MGKKTVAVAVAIIVALALVGATVALFTVGPLKPADDVYTPAGIEVGEVGDTEEPEPETDEQPEKEPEEPAEFDRDAAIAFARSFYSSATFTEDGWADMQERAASCGVVLDDSLRQPFDFYGSQYPDLAFAVVTYNSTYTREQESPEAIRIIEDVARAQDVCGERSYDATVKDIKKALEETLNPGEYTASINLVLTVSEDGKSATLTVDNPDWYIEQQ